MVINRKVFYKKTFRVMLPILLQNVVTNFVNLLDNVMVGQVGTEPMSGVAIANQLMFVFNLCIFGGFAGAGIYTAQFTGKGDDKGVCHTIRTKIYMGLIISTVFILLFSIFGGNLINLFLHEGNEGLSLAATYEYGVRYLRIMIIQIVPYMMIQTYASSLRECGETMVPMIASIAAVLTNLVGNYILIFGKLGAPAMGVVGAAIATVISRFVELGIIVIYAHTHTARFPHYRYLYRSPKVSMVVVKDICSKGTLLLLNELLWSLGQTTLNQCYSMRGIEVVSAVNIASTIGNLFMCAIFSAGSTINIMVGQQLGAGHLEEAEETQKRITVLSVTMCAVVGALLALCASPIAGFYNTSDSVKSLATQMMFVLACAMPFHAYNNACYFTLRTGGKVFITFVFDSSSSWLGYVTVAACLTYLTSLPIITIYICVNCVEALKCVMGYLMVRPKTWLVNLVADKQVE